MVLLFLCIYLSVQKQWKAENYMIFFVFQKAEFHQSDNKKNKFSLTVFTTEKNK